MTTPKLCATLLPSEIFFLQVEQVIVLHDALLLPGQRRHVQDMTMVESAVNSPQQGSMGGYYNATIFEMAAALCLGLARDHGFADGNKRTALVATVIFMQCNDVVPTLSSSAFRDLVLAVAARRMDKPELAKRLLKKSVSKKFTGAFTRMPRLRAWRD